MKKRNTLKALGALVLLLVLACFLAACDAQYYEPSVRISLKPDKLSMTTDEEKDIVLTVIKSSRISDIYVVTWSSDDTSVAMVEPTDVNGRLNFNPDEGEIIVTGLANITFTVKAVGEGSADITFTVTQYDPGADPTDPDYNPPSSLISICDVTVSL
jgi:hypothetical protein